MLKIDVAEAQLYSLCRSRAIRNHLMDLLRALTQIVNNAAGLLRDLLGAQVGDYVSA